ncbi:formate dehydrogenase accessory sulfurtransferase FdhD [Agromyces sp. SYSU T0242]|uniref:formate dehydrogenase accessory sulfurtransferase FdhD n=1 Tax=Agromyces litoreus TaxID=3158561 RepID=UPI00339A3AA9
MGRITARTRVMRVTIGAAASRREDHLAVEEPLEIRVGGERLAVTMRTPGHDVELATGFLVSEGVVSRGDQVAAAIHCGTPGENTYNVLDVGLAPGVPGPDAALRRSLTVTSSCGVCGKASIEAVRTRSSYEVEDDDLRLDPELLAALPDRLREGQAIFDRTGGLHAAGLFDARTGELLVLREDVGRHNAVDKVIGWAAQHDRLPLRSVVLQVSGRASFELAQKATMAGIPVLAAVSAPSSLAVEHAEASGLTLIGFSRGTSLVVYAGMDRILEPTEAR